jgi:monofunctional biosynthetic peptidoglycan transglycosylase
MSTVVNPGNNILFRQKIIIWIKKNKIVALSVIVLLWLIVEIAFLPFGDIHYLKKRNPKTTALIEQRRDEARRRGKKFRITQYWIPYNQIPKDLINSVIVAEDGTFWKHGGFDWFEFRESFEKNIREGRAARGASTITQQLAKNLYLSTSKTPLRKIKEWILTWRLENELSKSRILELYLNYIEWGDGVFGVKAAALFHFGKDVTLLSREECAKLAAIIPSPRRYKPGFDSRYINSRTRVIVERMNARGL